MRESPLAATLAALSMLPTALSAADGRIEEITVTVEKRETSLQDTPAAVSAFQGDFLRDLQLREIQDVVLRAPSMAYSDAGGEGQVYIRGVGANLLGIGQDSSVAVHQDGVYLGRPHLTLSQFLDVERVEVLRGPQGTLYGRNATAGVINVISRKPTEEYEGYASAYYGNFDRIELETGVGGPISDRIGFRLAGRWSDDDGYTDDLEPAGGDTIDDKGMWAARGIVDFRPSDVFSAEFIAEYGEADRSNQSVRRRDRRHISQIGDGEPDTIGGLPPACATCPALPNPDFDETRNELPTFQDWDILGLTLTLEWQLADNLSLTSITGYRDFEDDFSFNTDGVEAFVTNTQYHREAEQITQELRLAGDGDRLKWLLGVFYMNEDKDEDLGLPAVKFGGSFNIFATNETDAWAVFGQATYQLTDRLSVTAGLRYNDEDKDDCSSSGFASGDFTGLRNPNAFVEPCSNPAPPAAPRNPRNDSWDDWTPKLGVDFRVNEELLLYASITKGFKSGGTNSLAPGSAPFDQEEIWSYEIGARSDWLDGRLRVNGAAFYYDYTDLQVSTFDAITGTTRIENAASAEVFGAELEVSALLFDALTWNAGFAWLDTEYDDFVTTFGQIPNGGGPNVVDISGNELVNAPELKFVTDLRYDWQIGGNTLYLLGQLSWQDSVFHSQFNEVEVGQESFTLVDARVGYQFGQWELAALVKNAFDEEYFQNSVRFTSLSNTTSDPRQIGAALGYPGEGRSYGVQLRYRFGAVN